MSAGSLYEMPRNLVLAASAGTGKTHALVGVVLHLLLGGRAGGAVDPARIVATTFSRKAAAEIRARVAIEVEKLIEAPATSFYAAGLREAIGGRAGGAELTRRARKALARLPHARFGTLHSFATGIVQRYAVELGLGPGFELAAEADTRARADDAIARALERRLDRDAEALRVLTEAAGGIDRLVFGLRRVLVQLEEDGRPARELVVDPTDGDVVEREMDHLIRHARAVAGHPKTEEAASALLHAFAKHDGPAIEAAASALTGLAARGAKTPELEAFFVFRDELAGNNHADRGRRLARAWRSRHAFASHAELVRDVLAEAEDEIERAGRTRAVLGFGEVLRAARSLLTRRPDVAAEVSAGIEALLVDEFQDTSRVQRDLLQLLWARDDARPSAGQVPPLSALRGGGLLVVGDRKQSIYGFRGADVGVFAELAIGLAGTAAREALGVPPGVTWEPKEPIADFHALRHNRRSVPAILAFANAFSARRFVPGDPPPELFEIAYVPGTEDLLVPPEGRSDGEAPGSAPDAPRVTWLRVSPKGPTSTRLEEALVIASEIARLRAAGRELRDVAVLATTNSMLDAASFALAQHGLPYVVAGKGFFRAREVSDLAAMLALVLDPRDRVAMLEVLRGPWTGVHDETLLGLVEPGKGLVPPSRWTAPPTPALVRPEDRAALERTARLVVSLERAAGRLGPGTILREAVAALDLEALYASLPRGEQRVANVQKLLALADRYADPRAFRAWLDDAKEQEVSESEAATFSEADDAVRLLTVHASKGLDFRVVFVPEIGAGPPRTEKNVARVALGAGDAPNVLSVRVADASGMVLEPPSYTRAHAVARRRERAERQRLAYVAVTRAAEEMYFVGGRSTTKDLDMGASTLGVLEDVPADLLAVRDAPVPSLFEGLGLATPDGSPGSGDVVAPDVAGSDAVSAREPRWQVLPIAPTALADFEHCGRRFELVHILGLPEHARGARAAARDGSLDARAQGTIAHEVLERLPREAFGGAAEDATRRVLASVGVPAEHPQHHAIAARVLRFTGTRYARSVADTDALLEREVAFVLPVVDEQGRAVTLRGSMDLVVVWPDGAVDVVDYKSARGGDPESYAFQLDVYALAARARYPEATRLRAGLAFLGGGDGEPSWRELPPESDVRARIARLGGALVRARHRDAFPRVEIAKCEAIHCGFIGRCHPK